MGRAVLAMVMLFVANQSHSQITLECDFASSESQRGPMHYHWNISNRISPMGRFNMPAGENPKITVVRPLGGKSKGGEKRIDEDTYKWDGKRYVYDWTPLKKQIDTIRSKATLYQLLIDNPPWAFQRGIDLKGGTSVETYGNAWPPNDAKAWSAYIREMMRELIRTYGKEQVQEWRFCIGREIGTRGHWKGSMLEFFDHYRNTVEAIHSVLPNARVGAHFLWASAKRSYGPDFVRWCKRNKVAYDFVGVSYYPFYDRVERVDLEQVYKADFAPIKDIPQWNPEATLEIHEFALIKSMSKEGNSYRNASRDHQESFTAMLAKMLYDHGIVDVFRWGSGADRLAEATFLAMEGNTYFTSSKRGNPAVPGNMIDAVFARDEAKGQFNIVAFNYNADTGSKVGESVKIVTTLPVPSGTSMKVRNADYKTNKLEWSDWETHDTTAGAEVGMSKLEMTIQLSPLSFQKIEILLPESVIIRR